MCNFNWKFAFKFNCCCVSMINLCRALEKSQKPFNSTRPASYFNPQPHYSHLPKVVVNNSNFISELRGVAAVVVANYVEENLQLNYLEWMIMLLHYDNVHSNELRIIFCSQCFSSFSVCIAVVLQLPANCLMRIFSPPCLKSAPKSSRFYLNRKSRSYQENWNFLHNLLALNWI